MKTVLILLSVFCATLSFGQVTRTNPPPNITLAWTASPSPGLTTYRIYWGIASGSYTNVAWTGATNLSLTISNLVRGSTYFFAATAMDTNLLESVYSTEISYYFPLPPMPPVNLIIAP